MTPQFIAWYGSDIYLCAKCAMKSRYDIDFSSVRVSVYLRVREKKLKKTTDQKVI